MSPAAQHSVPGASPANWLWETAARLRAWTYRAGLRRSARLRAPVVSIGNLTFGGTGKTPFTIWLAGELGMRGYRLSILTRGYRRTSKGVQTYPAGSGRQQSGERHDGDEVQLFLRHLPAASVGVAARRFQAGEAIERLAPVDAHLLDDGFQHLQLARNFDVVLIDASNPWGQLSPGAGRLPRALREPLEALRRADALVLTRCELASPEALAALESVLRQIHPSAPLFRSTTQLAGLRAKLEDPSIAAEQLAATPTVAFCGIGNPENFFALLRHAGITLAATRAFPDHHRYNDQDLDQLNDLVRSRSAGCLLTTEKDVMNLPHSGHFADHFIVPAYWANISVAVEQQDKLLGLITQKIGPPSGGSGRH